MNAPDPAASGLSIPSAAGCCSMYLAEAGDVPQLFRFTNSWYLWDDLVSAALRAPEASSIKCAC